MMDVGVEGIIEALHLAGWSIGDVSAIGPAGRTVVVSGTYDSSKILAEGPDELSAWRAALEQARSFSHILTDSMFCGFFGKAGRPGEEFRRYLVSLGEDMTRSEFKETMEVFASEAMLDYWDVEETINGDQVKRRWYRGIKQKGS